MASIIPFFKEKQLKPAWNFDAGTLIWRIFFTSNNLIIGETRNQEAKSTGFFCVDIHTGKPLWKNISFDEPWWIGIEAVHERWMILHGFVRPDMPEHRGIRVIDVESGKLLWRNDTLSFWFVDDEILYAHKYLFEKHIGCELDIKTGTILNEYSDNLNLVQELRQKVLQKESGRRQDVVFPELFDENETDSVVRITVQRITEGKALEGWIEYLSSSDRLIVSQYRQAQNKSESSLLNNILSVYELKNEKMLYNEIIAKDVKTPSPDSFFIKDDLLFFINHQTMLTAIRIWKS
ncbi:MAG: DUF4905 domain-containing protein [Bacteroidota bacterium]|jgi:hypothetical protein